MRQIISLRLLPIALLQALVLASCSGTPTPVYVVPPHIPPLIEPVSVSIGIYYSDDLREHECIVKDASIFALSWIIRVGPPSTDMFNFIFKKIFKQVKTLESARDFESTLGKLPIIELRLPQFVCNSSANILGTTRININYEAILWSAAGEKIAQWNGLGEAGPKEDGNEQNYYYTVGSVSYYLGKLARLALRRAVADFIVNYSNSPEVQTWTTK